MIFSRILSSLIVFFLFAVFALIYLRLMERRVLFIPTRELETRPCDIGLDYEEENFITSDNVSLHGWFIPYQDAGCTVLFCHGNGGNISHRLEKLKFFNTLKSNVFIFDYRGYGKSQGRPSEEGLYIDVKAAYDYLLTRNIAPDEIIGFGESLGGAVIIDLASKNKIGALIVSGTISNAGDMAKQLYPYLPSWIFSSRLDSLNKIKSIDAPKLIIHSLQDEIVPFRLGEKLYQAAPGPKEFLQVSGTHNEAFYVSQELFRNKIGDFIKAICRGR
ncbi:MAG: alpha/beta hydrolase [Candidatus Omnitrophota bacterium]|nr:MAG: alpha/beta hydrolase [Candidatus Omnitrophota bacterium]